MAKYTPQQQNVIDYRGGNMLVSASAGTGKTTVMIERIAALIEEGADISELAVVTFTNLAAAEMKKRLSLKLAEKRNSKRMVEQLERLDNASISTLHSFCSELLRNYFYVANIDPAFAILDDLTVSALQRQALDDLFREYLKGGDQKFWRVYRIFSTHRSEENFKKTLLNLHNFSRCRQNFAEWYGQKRQNFLEKTPDNPVIKTVLTDICQTAEYCKEQLKTLAKRSEEAGLTDFAATFVRNAEILQELNTSDLQEAMFFVAKFSPVTLPRRSDKDFGADKETEESVRSDFEEIRAELKSLKEKYGRLCRGLTLDVLWEETRQATEVTDKLVEILLRFDEAYFALKKQCGGLDFNDLEHLTLKLFEDAETAAEIREHYKYVFVDEYQDINPVQEGIIAKLSEGAQLFTVGDVKQSIYGFRGCEPTIFLQKYQDYKNGGVGKVEELNSNFRSNGEILRFVNEVFCAVMTRDFGKVDYRDTAQLSGSTPPCLAVPSVQIDFVVKGEKEKREIDEIYDVTKDAEESNYATQGDLIAKRISEFVGQHYVDKFGKERRIGYGDVVILMRSLKDRAADIYNALVERNVPVAANFKTAGYANKEVRDVITLLRVIDNPFCDVYAVGLCLSPIGGFNESQLAQIKIATQEKSRVPFYVRMQLFLQREQSSELAQKTASLLRLLEKLRFYSYGATVDELALKALAETDFHLYVQGLPNGALRLRKLYAFIDGLKGASYAQSVDKFLAYLDETEDTRADEGITDTDAVRIMTMHASKGLEFPVVIVAGTETHFVTDRPSVERNAELGLATRYYDFDSMRVANTLGTTACGMFNRVKQQEEEMRLLYVAMTRAEFALDIVGTVSRKQLTSAVVKQPTSANSHIDWILTALKTKYGNFLQAQTDERITVTEQKENAVLFPSHNLLCHQYTDEAAVKAALSWKYPFEQQTKMPTKIVSSALDKEFLDVDESRADYVLEDNSDRNFVGTAYHKVYQYVNYDADKTEIQATIDFLVNNCKIDKQYAEKLDLELIYATLNNSELRKIMSQGKVYHELPFMLYVPYDEVAVDKRFSDDVMLQGVIDLLVLGNGSATVVDFKYTSRSDLVRKNYQAQLKSYRLAVQKICGIQDVKCYVLSVADNKLIDMN
ncbi:MAG: UvrD-helicase domain-containing protein [Corallococcus sp.]|nr:UvrD-helicase domain-containing protein [Corallococcus sp.]MCM1359952.1 UvrD-helicase domain-containing protein [Corallococcus sp.]MCM1395508.1 UvrD-helicase domain-containing protein [Corallococcus sp.]